MQLKTILNRVENFKSFVYGKARWVDDTDRPTIEIPIEARRNGRPICSGCSQARPGYDRLPPRRFEFVPLWGIAVFFSGCGSIAACITFGAFDENRLCGRLHRPITDWTSWELPKRRHQIDVA